MRRNVAFWGLAAGALVVGTLVACGSFDAEPGAAPSSDAGDAGDAGSSDGAALPDADPGSPDASTDLDGCALRFEEPFDGGYGPSWTPTVLDGGSLGVDGGELVASTPRPTASGGGDSQIETAQIKRDGESRYILEFNVRDLQQGLVGDRVRVGCTLKLLRTTPYATCDIFAVVVDSDLGADEDCDTPNTSTAATRIETLPPLGTDATIRLDVRVDDVAGTFTTRFIVNGQLKVTRTPMAFRPDQWQVKCGIDEAAVGAGNGGPYTVRVDSVGAATCGP